MIADDLVTYHGRLVSRSYRDRIVALVDKAPPFSSETQAKLRVLLRPAQKPTAGTAESTARSEVVRS